MRSVNAVKRPIVRYHGGKWMLAPWIISHFPEHKIYNESFGGGASVLLRKSRSFSEIYREGHYRLTNLQTKESKEAHHVVKSYPYTR